MAVETLAWSKAFIATFIVLLVLNLKTCLYKGKLYMQSVLYLLLCNDKKWKKPEDPGVIFKDDLGSKNYGPGVEKKTIIFVRHGESTWNDTFNKGERSLIVFIVGYIPNMLKALLYEVYLLLTGQMDSWFYDAPMSRYGLEQAKALQLFLSEDKSKDKGLSDREAEIIKIMRGEAKSSLIVSSNLRRAISTVAAAFSERFKRRPDDKIVVIPSLQEISRNPDTLSITPAHETVTASWIEKDSNICNFQEIFDKNSDMKLHVGNKPLSTNGLKRMIEFCKYSFEVQEEALIVGGHSIWFRSFFRTFLPYTVDHASKNRKVVNCGAVAFTLLKKKGSDNNPVFVVDPDSVTVIYGGFS